jgi:uncharacterized membrane protein SpoIIM required for sporulation
MDSAEEKQLQWNRFADRVERLNRQGARALRKLGSAELTKLIDDYQVLIADLARARSMGADLATVGQLNRIAVAGHNLLYGQMRRQASADGSGWFGSFARAVRLHSWAVALSLTMFFGSALASYVAVLFNPAVGYDLLDESFVEFDPASPENLHHIPSLARPVVSSTIIANNIQVTFMAFGLGLTAGIGTTALLIFNGIHLGSVAGWMTLHGKQRALWGWIMPHGGTELLAICLAGAAGYLLAGAIVAPGLLRRSSALKRIGSDALAIELGCMVMLVIAGAIEGFVSPSSIDYPSRIAVLGLSLLLWALYFFGASRQRSSGAPDQSGNSPNAATSRPAH